ncbi:hypothetical protein ACTS93_11810 [Empedobacter falsenii]
MRLIVVSRIDLDKDFFHYYLEVISRLKKEDKIIIKILFVGKIDNQEVYDEIMNRSHKLDIFNQINFTRQSIPYNLLPNEDNDYYLNISIGDFIGYSSIEGMRSNFKSIFLNGDSSVNTGKDRISFCNTTNELYLLLRQIFLDDTYKIYLIKDNEEILKNYVLSEKEEQLLVNILLG